MWAAVDLRAGLVSDLFLPQCVTMRCPSYRSNPGGTGVALVVGTDL